MTQTTNSNKGTATRAERKRARAVGISAALIMLMVVFAITFTAIALVGGDDPEIGGPGPGTGPTPIVFSSPLTDYTLLKGFDDIDVQWNATLSNWRTHEAISMGAALGTPVLATYAGTIESIRNTLYGTEVTINHGDGLKTVLRSLEKETTVREGQAVSRGQKIGTVGTTSTFEFTNTPHIRLEVIENGKNIDPGKYIDFGNK